MKTKIHIRAIKHAIDFLFSERIPKNQSSNADKFLPAFEKIEGIVYVYRAIDTRNEKALNKLAETRLEKFLNEHPDNTTDLFKEKEIETAKAYQTYFPEYKNNREHKEYYFAMQRWIECLQNDFGRVYFIKGGKQVSYNLIELNYSLDQQKEIVKLFFDELNNKLFNTTYEKFERHFIESKTKLEKIQWKGYEPQIRGLFKWLDEKSMLKKTDVNILITHHFKNRKGNEFDSKQLSVVCSKLTYSFENLKIIPPLTEKLEKLVLTFN